MFYSNELKKNKNIKHCFFSRNNGFSKGIYESLNCGPGSNDSKSHISQNLNFISQQMNVNKENLKLMNQSHSNDVIVVNEKNKKNLNFDCDAMVTKIKGVALAVLTADCVPIILYDKKNEIISVVHSGWKGAFSGIIKNTINVFKSLGSKNEIYATIGPCIGLYSYEVKEDFYKLFIKNSPNNKKYFIPKNDERFNFDLRKYVENKLKESGVKSIDNVNFDTFKENQNFFSYRRSILKGDKDYGRCISSIVLNSN